MRYLHTVSSGSRWSRWTPLDTAGRRWTPQLRARPMAGRPRKRQAMSYGLEDAGAAADFEQLAAAARTSCARSTRGAAANLPPAAAAEERAPVAQVVGQTPRQPDDSEEPAEDSKNGYHIEMLNDRNRNSAYATAVRHAVTAAAAATAAPPQVLEIGAGGAALLSLVAAEAGAARCVAVELDPELAEYAQAVIASNSSRLAGGSVAVAVTHSTELQRTDNTDVDGPITLPAAGVDVLLSELFDDRLLGEQMLTTTRHALASLVAPHRLVVPARAAIFAALVQSDTLAAMSAPPAMGTSVVAAPVADPIEPMRLDGLPDLKLVSVPWQALSFDFGNPQQSLAGHRTVNVPITSSSSEEIACGYSAVIFWWRATLWDGDDDGAGPVMISSADPDGHWTPCVWPFEPAEYSEESRRFGAQSHVRVTAWHDEQSVEFSLAEEPEEAADEKEQEKKAASVDRDRATLVSEEEDNGEEEDEEGEDEASESAAAGDGDDEDAGESAAAGGGAAEATGEDEAKEEEEEEDGSDGEEPMAPPIERTRRWMLADKARTSAISGAIVQTVESATAKATGTGTVVCVGGGSGLCASAASGTCKHVIAVEWTEDHATAVRGALSSSREVSDEGTDITVVHGAGELKETLVTLMTAHGHEGEQHVDALLAEPLFVPLDEGRAWAKGHALLWWWSVHAVRSANLLAPTAKVWPAVGRLRGVLVSFDRLWSATRPVPTAEGAGTASGVEFDISAFGEGALARMCSYGRSTPIWQHSHTVISEPFDLLEMQFGDTPPPNLATMADGGVPAMLAPREGAGAAAAATAAPAPRAATAVNALVVWIDYADADGCWPAALSTGPGAHRQPTAWSQGVWFLDEPLPIDHNCSATGGAIASVNASLDTLSGNLKVEVVPATQQ